MIRADLHSMARLGGFDGIFGSEPLGEIDAALRSDEKDRVSLKLRLKTLLASKRIFGQSAVNAGVFEDASDCPSKPVVDVVKKEDVICDSKDHLCFHSANFATEGRESGLSQDQAHSDMCRVISKCPWCRISESLNSNGTQADSYIYSNEMSSNVSTRMDEFFTNIGTSPQHSVPPNISAEVKIDHRDNGLASSLGDGIIGFSGSDAEAVKIKNEVTDDCGDEFDHMSSEVSAGMDEGFGTSPQHSVPPNISAEVKIDHLDNGLASSLRYSIIGFASSDAEAVNIKNEVTDDCVDELDHMPLIVRQRMLWSRKLLGVKEPTLEGNYEQLSSLFLGLEGHAGMNAGGGHSISEKSLLARTPFSSITKERASDLFGISVSGSLDVPVSGTSCIFQQCTPLVGSCQGAESTKSRNYRGDQESDQIYSSKDVNPCHRKDIVLALPRLAKLKDEQLDWNEFPNSGKSGLANSRHLLGAHEGNMNCTSDERTNPVNFCGKRGLVPDGLSVPVASSLLNSVHVKNESVVENEFNANGNDSLAKSLNGLYSVKTELQTPDEYLVDFLDHMPLQDRFKILVSRDKPNMSSSSAPLCFPKNVPSFRESQTYVSESFKPNFEKRSRKRKRTCTDSVETALEEDAPGLVQILVDRGVSMDEIKLYGETENDGPLDDCSIEGSFSELEAVISKIFSQRHSLLKFAPIRCTKGAKASYCLACLVSLVEQTRYLRFRNWPVEWGWCRDLHSFIFVFERHNRIVLERPEYGYATYFFEIANSLPIQWQIKRLVTAMKLTNFSRISLIENKSLLVGEDLSEGEARVLMEYGWEPNSGLGTMLNYRDRVVHDKKSEVGTEWRSKIGKLLADGYNSGTMISKKDVECTGQHGSQIKLEY